MNLPINYDRANANKRRKAREEYVILQEGKCCHCGNPLDDEPTEEMTKLKVTPKLYPPQFFRHTVHLHHAHDTGLTIGAVHNYCNAILWEYHGE